MAANDEKPPKKPRRRTKRRTTKKGPPPADWAPAFLTALASTCNVTDSARLAGVGRRTAYDRRAAQADFAAAWDEAVEAACDALELEARRRAKDGVSRLKFHMGELLRVPVFGPDGKPVTGEDGRPLTAPYVEREYSDTLLIFLLKAHRPKKYRETVKHEHGGEDGKPFEHVVFYVPANGREPAALGAPPARPAGDLP